MTTDTLATVARFTNPMQATLARNDLEAAGIKAFLVGEAFTSMAWHLTNAVGGIRLQVAIADVEQAQAILSRPAQERMNEGVSGDKTILGAEGEAIKNNAWDEINEEVRKGEEEESTEEFKEATRRDEIADRALRGAACGILFLPLQFYVLWLLLKVLASNEQLSRRSRKRALWAAVISLPYTILLTLVVAYLITR
jgi:hypothetical protein